MHSDFADEFMRAFGKGDGRVGGTACVFFEDLTKLGLGMGLQRLANIDLLARDLIAHWCSFSLWIRPAPGPEAPVDVGRIRGDARLWRGTAGPPSPPGAQDRVALAGDVS